MFDFNDEHDLDNRWQHAGLIRIKREQAKSGGYPVWLTVMCDRSLAFFDVRAIYIIKVSVSFKGNCDQPENGVKKW